MIIDLREIEQERRVDADICIVGAGAAGISLAMELIDSGFQVCLLESGGLEYNDDTQALYDGSAVGLPYSLTESRVRQFGGTTAHWSGWCWPLEAIDFEKRDWVPHSGWPFSKSHLDPYYERAQSVLTLGPFNYDPGPWESDDIRQLSFTDDAVRTKVIQFSNPPTRFGSVYRQKIKAADNVTAYLNANAVDIETDRPAANVTGVRAISLNGKTMSVKARICILAAGGIENARLLLQSNKVQTNGLGNGNDLVGRFFMDHAVIKGGLMVLSDPQAPMELYRRWRHTPDLRKKIDGGSMEKFIGTPEEKETLLAWIRNGAREQEYDSAIKAIIDKNCVTCHQPGGVAFFRPLTVYEEIKKVAKIGGDKTSVRDADQRRPQSVMGALTLSDAMQREHKLLNYCAVLEEETKGMSSLLQGDDFFDAVGSAVSNMDLVLSETYRKVTGSSDRRRIFRFKSILESMPNPDSRVTLSDDRDRLGQNKVQLDWKLTREDRVNVSRVQELIGRELGRSGLGRLMHEVEEDDRVWSEPIEYGWHHMGTTRMHDDPTQGVVDAQCKVHGLTNLFVASSSVFPTYGYANPTLTIVALSIRLADHIKRELSSSA